MKLAVKKEINIKFVSIRQFYDVSTDIGQVLDACFVGYVCSFGVNDQLIGFNSKTLHVTGRQIAP